MQLPLNRSAAALLILLGSSALVSEGQVPPLPGTSIDRIGFPTNYQDTFTKIYTFDNFQNRQIRVVWANDVATMVNREQAWNFPYGSVVLFESYSVKQDAAGEPLLDENGRFIPNVLTTIFVQKKMPGFGSEYGAIQSGEWEYIAYTPDGNVSTAPAATGACSLCHRTGSNLNPAAINFPRIGAQWDYVFRPELFFNRNTNEDTGGVTDAGAVPNAVLQSYVFVPNTIHVTAGQRLTFQNDDQLVHNIVADDGSFNSGYIGNGGNFSITPATPGQMGVHCTIHSRMKATIIVDPPAQSRKIR